MRRRPILAAALSTAVVFGPWAHATEPQVTDPVGDANLISQVLPVGSQTYADIVSTKWENVKKNGRPAFRVTLVLAGPPTPPPQTNVAYRALSEPAHCDYFGVVYYSSKYADKTIPRSALRENCVDGVIRLTEIPLPEISGSTITWTVPLSLIPKDTNIKRGTTLRDLYTHTNKVLDFRGTCLPDDGGVTGSGNACGTGAGVLDQAFSAASFKL